ncbi:MAG: HNH endonuclease [Bacteroidia bacterium]
MPVNSNQYYQDAASFARMLSRTKLNGKISFGQFFLKYKEGVTDIINYNSDPINLLKHSHEYTFKLLAGMLQVSLQLYKNINGHFKFYCCTKFGHENGVTFSVNLTTSKESSNIIYLTQKIKFSEQYEGNGTLAQAHRRQKQIVFCDLLKKLGFELSDSNDIILGIYDPAKKKLVNITPEKLLNDFIVISLLKGHFQGNKGYQLEILPSFNKLDYIYTGKEDAKPSTLPGKLKKNKTQRTIPLGMRYVVLKRDGFRCIACGHGIDDNAKLHIDHKLPFSLGGLTELKNLQTLCEDCNLSKSNRHIDA